MSSVRIGKMLENATFLVQEKCSDQGRCSWNSSDNLKCSDQGNGYGGSECRNLSREKEIRFI